VKGEDKIGVKLNLGEIYFFAFAAIMFIFISKLRSKENKKINS
jgi:hypothetical protein